MVRERILITVKTYPTLSKKYGETVCTAGVKEDGTWIRLYPVPFRRLEESEQYKKFDWIVADITKSRSDPRPESHNPINPDQLRAVDHIDTKDNWRERRQILLKNCRVYDKLEPLLSGAKKNTMSLAIFKPSKIRGFISEDDERDWDIRKVTAMRNLTNQAQLFEEDAWRQTFQLIPKLPYAFSYQFEDGDQRRSTMQILDWECGQLYWNCLRAAGNDEDIAIEKVKAKYMDEFAKRDLHFLLGTTQQFHGFSPNPWVIIGVFAPPYEDQLELPI